MKAIIVDIKDMSDSREVYQSKPYPFVWIFTYILLAIFASALLWASIGRIEIVVKANGQVRPVAGISTVKNLYGGVVKELKVAQGDSVKKGDLLYSIEHDALTVEKDNLERQREDLKIELNNLNQYRQSIDTEQNIFDEIAEPVYYQKVKKLLLEIEFAKNDANYKVIRLKEEGGINNSQLSSYKREKDSIEAYIKSLDENKNLVETQTDTDAEYYQKFEKYQITYRDINRKYDEQANQIKASDYAPLKKTLEEEKALKDAYIVLLESINQEKNMFEIGDKYAYLYDDYVFKMRDLENQYNDAKALYEAYKAMGLYGVSIIETENAKTQMEKAEAAYLNYETGYKAEVQKTINDKEISIMDMEGRISGAFDVETLLELNDEDRNNAIKKLYLDERQAMLDYKEKIIDTINSLSLNIKLGETELKSIESNIKSELSDNTVGRSLYIERLKTQEIVETDEKIKTIIENIKTLDQSIKKAEIDIDNAIVTANIDGTVNVLYEMLPGDFITSGQEVMTIIPADDSAYTMQIYVSNKDIGELKVNSTVKYNFAALPHKEYGEMRGQVTSISKDAVMNESNGQSFYIVKATIPGTKVIGANGKQGDIKVGMLCEASIITKEKSFLRYFLEKIDLLD